MIASAQITNTEIFEFIAVLNFKLLRGRVLFVNRKNYRNCLKAGFFFRKKQISRANYSKIINS